jgi:urea transport system permease protein
MNKKPPIMPRFNLIFSFRLVTVMALLAGWVGATTAYADEVQARHILAKAMISGDDRQVELVDSLIKTGEPQIVGDYLGFWKRGDIYIYKTNEGEKIPVYISSRNGSSGSSETIVVSTGEVLKDSAGKPLNLDPRDMEAARPSRSARKEFTRTTELVALNSPQPDQRAKSALNLGLKQAKEYLPVLTELRAKETDRKVCAALDEGIAVTLMATGSKNERLAAIGTLEKLHSIAGLNALENLRTQLGSGSADIEFNAKELAKLDVSIKSIKSYISLINFIGTCFRGLSLGAVLLIAALGLSITFGVMGIINMAHGEMIALGAYCAFISEQIFTTIFANKGMALEYYFLFAIPLSFFIAALCGLFLERCVIRYLYKRPLESLLATWSVSLILQQGFRLVFGAANRQVNSPSWLLGNIEFMNLTFGYNRIFVILFAMLIVIGTWLLMTRTALGLSIRAVMEDPEMAAAMGIRIGRVRMITFAFGSGLAGLAGVFLSQIGSVGSNLGQSYIVDSFMVVVVGGVGNIAGSVISALGIGVVDQALQPEFGPVMGRITVLVAIILFLQWKPGGLFSNHTRNLD